MAGGEPLATGDHDHPRELDPRWAKLRELRTQVTEAIEPLRREKVIGSSLQAVVTVPEMAGTSDDLSELFIVSSVKQGDALSVAETENNKCENRLQQTKETCS